MRAAANVGIQPDDRAGTAAEESLDIIALYVCNQTADRKCRGIFT